jgi:hypothetical protein
VFTRDPSQATISCAIEPTFQNQVTPTAAASLFPADAVIDNITERSSDLRMASIATNVTTTNAFSYRDTNAVDALRFYRMKIFTVLDLLP